MSDSNQPNNHDPKDHIFTMGGIPIVERSRSVNTPAPPAEVGVQIDQMNDNYAAASATAAASGRPTKAAVDAIAAVANNANNAIVTVADKAIDALRSNANAVKVATTQGEGGPITHKRGRAVPVSKDEGCSNYEEVKEEVPAYKKAK